MNEPKITYYKKIYTGKVTQILNKYQEFVQLSVSDDSLNVSLHYSCYQKFMAFIVEKLRVSKYYLTPYLNFNTLNGIDGYNHLKTFLVDLNRFENHLAAFAEYESDVNNRLSLFVFEMDEA